MTHASDELVRALEKIYEASKNACQTLNEGVIEILARQALAAHRARSGGEDARVKWLESLFKFEDDEAAHTAPNDPVTRDAIILKRNYCEAEAKKHATLRTRLERVEKALNDITTACEKDCGDGSEEEFGDDEAVAATQAEHGPIKDSALTFGMIRRARAALAHEEKKG